MGRCSRVSILAFTLLSCGDGGTVAPEDGAIGAEAGGPGPADAGVDGGSSDAAVASSDAAPDAPATGPSAAFRNIYDTILMPRCGGVGVGGQGCHIGNAPPGLFTMPDAPTAFATLVNKGTMCLAYPEQSGRQVRVVPFDPAGSAIMLVNGDGVCGVRHGPRFLQARSLTTAELATLEDWIRQGAR